jgi:hypothetical protein
MLEQLAAPVGFPGVSRSREGLAAGDVHRLRRGDHDADQDGHRARREGHAQRAVVYRPVREHFDYFLPYFELSGFPVRGIKSFQYIDAAGVQQTDSLERLHPRRDEVARAHHAALRAVLPADARDHEFRVDRLRHRAAVRRSPRRTRARHVTVPARTRPPANDRAAVDRC